MKSRKCWILVLALTGCAPDVPIGSLCPMGEPQGDQASCPDCQQLDYSALQVCTETCLSDEQCQVLHPDAACVVACYRTCEADETCPDGTGCQAGKCTPLCTTDADCVVGKVCGGKFCG